MVLSILFRNRFDVFFYDYFSKIDAYKKIRLNLDNPIMQTIENMLVNYLYNDDYLHNSNKIEKGEFNGIKR